MKIESGLKGIYIPLMTLIAIYSVSVVTSLPGLAIAPILGKLQTIFPNVSDVDLQQLESLPSFMIIPFILLSGKLSVNSNKSDCLLQV